MTALKIVPLDLVRKRQGEKLKETIANEIKKNSEVFNGVYMIHNTLNNRKYIGSSNDINRRFQTHRRELDAGSHNNRLLQKDYDETGPNLFKYVILERDIPKDLLTSYEKYWMYKHDSIVRYKGYNKMFPTTNHKSFKQVYISKEGENEHVQSVNS